MWHLAAVDSPCTLWCSDGKPVGEIRGGIGGSSRFIVDGQGFLDISELNATGESEWVVIDSLDSADEETVPVCVIDANGLKVWQVLDHEPSLISVPLHLEIMANGKFNMSMMSNIGHDFTATSSRPETRVAAQVDFTAPAAEVTACGSLKPLPQVSAIDVALFDTMIADKLVPYPNVDDTQGKSENEIRALGKQLFPFSPYSFQLAMAVYDWTTASFTRLVLLNMFRYTALELQGTAPLDQHSMAKAIWTSNWGSFTAQDPQFMASFMMKPAWSQLEVELQLLKIRTKLETIVEAENRLLHAAMQSLPRTSILDKPQLFSGQLDLSQLDIEDFAISFRECPANKGPIFQPLKHDLRTATSTYLAEGSTVTTKVTWSFTDSMDEAMHYSNGIILVANFSDASRVWETGSYITPLSIDPKKIEYTFPPGSQFEVQSVDETILRDQSFIVFTIQPKLRPIHSDMAFVSSDVNEVIPSLPKMGDTNRVLEMCTPFAEPSYAPHNMGGRRCNCFPQKSNMQ